MIPGLENEPLVPGEELLALPGFWAAYLLWLAEGEYYEPEPDAFGVDATDARRARRLQRGCTAATSDDWPIARWVSSRYASTSKFAAPVRHARLRATYISRAGTRVDL